MSNRVKAGAIGLGALLVAKKLLKVDQEKFVEKQEEIELLKSFGFSEISLEKTSKKERSGLFRQYYEGKCECSLCKRKFSRFELAQAEYIFWPVKSYCFWNGEYNLNGLMLQSQPAFSRMLRICSKGWEEREKEKLVRLRENAVELPREVQKCVYQELGFDGNTLICPECAEKVVAILTERIKDGDKVETFPHTYHGKIPCDESSSVFVSSYSHPLKQDALRELKEFASICKMDFVTGIEYQYEYDDSSEWGKSWTAAGRMAKRVNAS